MAQTQQSGEVLKQSVSFTRMLFFGTTGQTLTVNLSKAGATFAGGGGTASEVANGWYKYLGIPADVSVLGDLAWHVTAGAGGPLDFQDQVVVQTAADIVLGTSGNPIVAGSLRQNQAFNAFPFTMTSGGVLKPGVAGSISIQRSLGSAGFAPIAGGSIADLGNGAYTVNLAASDLNATSVTLQFTGTNLDTNIVQLILAP